MITKDELRQYRHIKGEMMQLAEEIRELDMLMVVPSVQNLSGMPGAHMTTDKIGETIARADALRKRYYAKISILLDLKAKIEMEIDGLSADDQMLIRLYYFRGMTWEAAAATMGLSWNALHYRHRNILRRLKGDGNV
ncbi:MAG: sigma-70 family RNA polymerase sigma factor [Bacteroidales bacterium]|nr:sigma-70 family RNA polymerase sigma factor [Bacteroidales bacterium]MBQ8809541.1 sigma-70 family RNA polymerase sigma factor [Bacteroidales bacterium]